MGAIKVKEYHNLSNTREYSIWVNMLSRCRNKNDTCYKNYGKRGIRVCEAWSASFMCFIDDMGVAPSNKHSIDRVNNDGDYEPSNCRWATISEQNRNKRYKNKSGLRGVYWLENRKLWLAYGFKNKSRHYLGSFKSMAFARQARQDWMVRNGVN